MERVRQTSFTPAEHDKYRTMQEVYSRVGAVASWWASFEMEIDLAALRLAGLNASAIAMCFTAHIMGAGRKLDAYVAVAKERGSTKFAAELEAMIKDTASMTERRNRIVHDMWIVESPELIGRFEVTARRKLRSLVVPVSLPALSQCMADIAAHSTAFRNLDLQIQAEVGTSPDKPAP